MFKLSTYYFYLMNTHFIQEIVNVINRFLTYIDKYLPNKNYKNIQNY